MRKSVRATALVAAMMAAAIGLVGCAGIDETSAASQVVVEQEPDIEAEAASGLTASTAPALADEIDADVASQALSDDTCGPNEHGAWSGSGVLTNAQPDKIVYLVKFVITDTDEDKIVGRGSQRTSLKSGESVQITVPEIVTSDTSGTALECVVSVTGKIATK